MLPISLNLKNFFSHKDSFVDFSKFKSALLIGNVEGDYTISNGSGKSSIFEGVLWCLFNKSRASPMDDIIRWGENTCIVELIFKHKSETYKIIRTRSRVSSSSTVKFYRLSFDGSWVDLSGSTAGLTNKIITDTIKLDWKTFVNSGYFRQNDISEFAESDPSRKKEILKSIIDISKWDEYVKKAKIEAKRINSECMILSSSIEKYDEIRLALNSSKESLDSLKKEVENKTTKRGELDKTISELSDKYSKIKATLDTDTWDKIVEENNLKKRNLKRLKEKLEESENSLVAENNKSDVIKEKIKNIKDKIDSLEIMDDVEDRLKKRHEEFIKFKSDLLSAEEIIKVIKEKKVAQGECYVCKQEIGDNLFHKLAEDRKQQLDVYEKQIIYSKNKIAEYNFKIKELEVFKNNNAKKEELLSSSKSLESNLESISTRISALSKDIENHKFEIKDLELKIEVNNQILSSLKNENFQKLHEEIDSLKNEKASLILEIEAGNRKLGVLLEKTSEYRKKITEMKETRKSLKDKQGQALVFDKMIKMMGKNGIQTILLNAIIEDLEKTSNKILASICNEPFIVMLETQRVHSDGVSIVDTLDLKIRKSGISMNFSSLSGGEQFRISLALRIALSEISSRHSGSNLEFLLLDEINSPLDRHGTENLFVNVIKSLEDKYKILVITHDDTLKEKFDSIVNITNINGESSVEFVNK